MTIFKPQDENKFGIYNKNPYFSVYYIHRGYSSFFSTNTGFIAID
jgi:hypothetical protein